MHIQPRSFVLVQALAVCAMAAAQSSAALEKILSRHTVADVDEMREQAHFRYQGELLFYSSSFLIEENGQERSATEAEIAAIDLHAYDGVRMEDQRTGVVDPLIDRHVILLSRKEFEQLVLGRYSEADRAAYHAWKKGLPQDTGARTR